MVDKFPAGPWQFALKELVGEGLHAVTRTMGDFVLAFTVRPPWYTMQNLGVRCIETRKVAYRCTEGSWVANILSNSGPPASWTRAAVRDRVQRLDPNLVPLCRLPTKHVHLLHFISGCTKTRTDPRVAAVEPDWGREGDVGEDADKWPCCHLITRTLWVTPGIPCSGSLGISHVHKMQSYLVAPRRVFEVNLKKGKVML